MCIFIMYNITGFLIYCNIYSTRFTDISHKYLPSAKPVNLAGNFSESPQSQKSLSITFDPLHIHL